MARRKMVELQMELDRSIEEREIFVQEIDSLVKHATFSVYDFPWLVCCTSHVI